MAYIRYYNPTDSTMQMTILYTGHALECIGTPSARQVQLPSQYALCLGLISTLVASLAHKESSGRYASRRSPFRPPEPREHLNFPGVSARASIILCLLPCLPRYITLKSQHLCLEVFNSPLRQEDKDRSKVSHSIV